jgi:hypothetical protein
VDRLIVGVAAKRRVLTYSWQLLANQHVDDARAPKSGLYGNNPRRLFPSKTSTPHRSKAGGDCKQDQRNGDCNAKHFHLSSPF